MMVESLARDGVADTTGAFPFRKLLLPIDFSMQSAGAVTYSKFLAEQFGAGLTLLHVIPPLREVAPDAHFPEFTDDAARQQMQGILERESLSSVKTVIRTGDPARTIVSYSRSEHSDLIVMPTHGYGRFRRFFVGSVVQDVLRDAPCPVWTGVDLGAAVPPGSSRFQQIVCAIDLGPTSECTVKLAAVLANRSQAALRLIHVLARFDAPEKVKTEARERMTALETDCGIHAAIELISGDVSHALSSAVARLGADLLVIGRHPRQDSRRDGVAYAIVRQAHCPVVSVL